MNEHTPGPWYFDGGAQIVEAERPHMRIAFLPSDHAEYASSKPNAHLIAAAPTMAAAIEAAVVNGLDIDGSNRVSISREHFNDLMDALAKATGASTAA